MKEQSCRKLFVLKNNSCKLWLYFRFTVNPKNGNFLLDGVLASVTKHKFTMKLTQNYWIWWVIIITIIIIIIITVVIIIIITFIF